MIGLVFSLMSAVAVLAVAAERKGPSTVTLEGQVVCSSCWFEADRKVTPYGLEADLTCAAECAKDGKAQAIAVKGKEGITLYLLEPGKLKRNRKDWLDFIARRVKATGRTSQRGGKVYLKVDSIELTAEAVTSK